MKKIAVLLFVFFVPLSGVKSADWGLSNVTGSDGYYGLNGYYKYQSDLGYNIKPSVSAYTQDGLSDTMITYAVRGGYDLGFLEGGLTFGLTPKANNYKNTIVSADVVFTHTPSVKNSNRLINYGVYDYKAVETEGFNRYEAGMSLSNINHSSSSVSPTQKINQTDISFSLAGLFDESESIPPYQVNLTYTQNLNYSANPTSTSKEPLKADFEGMLISVMGFMDNAFNMRAYMFLSKYLSPYFSYTYVNYKVIRADSNSYVFGAEVYLKKISLNIAYQIFDPGEGASKRNFFSIGAGFNL